MEANRPVIIMELPQRLNLNEARTFLLQEIHPFFAADRPQLVFDLAMVKQIDFDAVEMLLACMAECIKRDGDLKLANLSSHSASVLELTHTDRIFEIHKTSDDAVRSFAKLSGSRKSQGNLVA